MTYARLVLLCVLVAGCGGGGSNDTPPDPGSTDTTAPSVPQGLTATAGSGTAIALAWQASTDTDSGVGGYRVFRDGASAPIATVTSTGYTDTGLSPATEYSYTVRAFDNVSPPNESANSQTASATTLQTPPPDLSLTTEPAFPNLPNFDRPVLLQQAPGDAARWYVVEQAGRVLWFDNDQGVTTTHVFADISARVRSGGEMGLLGMAFHPGYPADPRVYLSYTSDAGGLVSRISEFRTQDGGQTLDAGAEVILLTVAQPTTVHKGGNVVFGPDGNLYIGFGDGGAGGNGQDLLTLLGKVLRIDVNGSTGAARYRIPAGNPHTDNSLCTAGTGNQPCPEIFAYGFRNPWRWSFDRATGDLWVGDVGQSSLEEVDRVSVGGNYGWRCFEGTQVFNSDCGPNATSSLPPVAQYGRDAGRSITGGYVYRGNEIPALFGRYVFADFSTGRIWSIPGNTAPTRTVQVDEALVSTGMGISSFAQDVNGELYVVDYGGTLHRLRPGD